MLIENNTEALAKQTFGYVDYVYNGTFEIDEELEKLKITSTIMTIYL